MSAFNTNQYGLPFKEAQKALAWERAQAVPLHDPNVVRKDPCGAWIRWADYGRTDSNYGWEIDHIFPKARGGGDEPSNLQALHWQNNRAKGDQLPLGLLGLGAASYCVVRAV